MQRISVNLTRNNALLPAIGDKNYACQKLFVTDFLATNHAVAKGTQFCPLTYFFNGKLYATIISS